MAKTRKMFRSSMGGFNKADVNNYIVAQSREFDEKKASLEDEIARLSLKNKELADLLAFTEMESAALTSRIEELEEITNDLVEIRAELSAAQAENESLKEKLADAEANALRLTELQEEIARLSEEAEASAPVEETPEEDTPVIEEERKERIVFEKDIFSDALANAIISEVISKINSASTRERVILRRDRILDTFKKNLNEAKQRIMSAVIK